MRGCWVSIQIRIDIGAHLWDTLGELGDLRSLAAAAERLARGLKARLTYSRRGAGNRAVMAVAAGRA